MKRPTHLQTIDDPPSDYAVSGSESLRIGAAATTIKALQGPILVVGAHGFAGANLLKVLLRFRQDAYGTTPSKTNWRLQEVAPSQLRQANLADAGDLKRLLDDVRPRTVFNCLACETQAGMPPEAVYDTHFLMAQRLLADLEGRDIACYVHVNCAYPHGNESEQGATPREHVPFVGDNTLDSDAAVAETAAHNLIGYYGVKKHFPCVVVRLVAPYGPMLERGDAQKPFLQVLESISNQEDSGTPKARAGSLPSTLNEGLYIDDACNALAIVATRLDENHYGLTFDVNAGRKHGQGGHARSVQEVFGWVPTTRPTQGLEHTLEWLRSIGGFEGWARLNDESADGKPVATKNSISAIVACYNEGPAIPVMYQRLRDTFVRLGIDYEIIFVNNGSKDNSEMLIQDISSQDHNVIGITHSRSFGAETSSRSGLEIASKDACVLLDGDLQDPPEMIEQFLEKWREGYDVVYGRRVKRDAPRFMQVSYKMFYRLFAYFSYVPMPRDAGDFSLLDRRVVDTILQFKERDLFLRGIRAYVGFNQVGVDYVRPERMFGRTSNNIMKNIGWAKKGILSFTRMPLDLLSYAAVVLVLVSMVLGVLQVAARLIFPQSTAWGVTTILIVILFFGSINLFAISLVGEYIAKIFDEVKQRPLYIRRAIIRDGEIKPTNEVFPGKEMS